MSDLISRQAAIDEIKEIYEWHDNVTKERIIEHFVRLPSAQPEKRTEKRTETHACDLIDRQAAIRWVKTECNPYGKPTLDFESGKKVIEHLEQMPPARPDRDVIDDCLYHIYKNISVHTATGGVITIRYYMEKLYEEIYGEGEKPWWMT